MFPQTKMKQGFRHRMNILSRRYKDSRQVENKFLDPGFSLYSSEDSINPPTEYDQRRDKLFSRSTPAREQLDVSLPKHFRSHPFVVRCFE